MAKRQYPERVIPRHSLKTRITHDIVAVTCLWLMVSGAFVFVPALAAAFPAATQFFRMSHRVMGAIFIVAPILSAITSPRGFKEFLGKYFVKWTPQDWEFLKKFVPYMLGAKRVHMPDQDEVKSGQRFADGLLILSSILIAVSGVVLWLGTSVFHASAGVLLAMRTCHDVAFILLIVFGLAHIYLGAGIFQPYRGTSRLMWGDGKVTEADALYHWGFWARKQIEKGNYEEVKK
ncbi:MAG: cytochrome b/b6 domain-containing protein [Coriobacteriales bacterium]|jgi:formate dehydrogenase subunit gamma